MLVVNRGRVVVNSRSLNLKTALGSTSGAKSLAFFAGGDTSINSILAVSAARDDSQSSSVAKRAKAALSFTVISGQFGTEMVLASQTTISKAAESKK